MHYKWGQLLIVFVVIPLFRIGLQIYYGKSKKYISSHILFCSLKIKLWILTLKHNKSINFSKEISKYLIK